MSVYQEEHLNWNSNVPLGTFLVYLIVSRTVVGASSALSHHVEVYSTLNNPINPYRLTQQFADFTTVYRDWLKVISGTFPFTPDWILREWFIGIFKRKLRDGLMKEREILPSGIPNKLIKKRSIPEKYGLYFVCQRKGKHPEETGIAWEEIMRDKFPSRIGLACEQWPKPSQLKGSLCAQPWGV